MKQQMTLALALASVACGSAAGATQPDDTPAATSRGTITPATTDDTETDTVDGATEETDSRSNDGVPADVDTLRSLLGARHVADLPDADTVAAYATGEESLMWLTEHGDTLMIRVRALSLLQHFPTPSVRDFALLYLDAARPRLYAAAITALSGHELENDTELRGLVAEALFIDDVRIGLAAITALLPTSTGREALERACEEEAIPPRIREAVMELLSAPTP